jgi:lauroyl/myristoyl acyltransferase
MLKKIRYRLEFVGLAAAVRVVPWFPLSLLRWVTWAISWPVLYLDRRSRRVALANLAAAFGDRYTPKERERIARTSIQVVGQRSLELFWPPRINQKNFRSYLRWHDEEFFHQILRMKGDRAVIGLVRRSRSVCRCLGSALTKSDPFMVKFAICYLLVAIFRVPEFE